MPNLSASASFCRSHGRLFLALPALEAAVDDDDDDDDEEEEEEEEEVARRTGAPEGSRLSRKAESRGCSKPATHLSSSLPSLPTEKTSPPIALGSIAISTLAAICSCCRRSVPGATIAKGNLYPLPSETMSMHIFHTAGKLTRYVMSLGLGIPALLRALPAHCM